jgi:hypothetical protein
MFDGGLSNLREVGFPMRKYYGSKNEKVVMDEVRPTSPGLISDFDHAPLLRSLSQARTGGGFAPQAKPLVRWDALLCSLEISNR